MKENILLVTSPWSKFSNYADPLVGSLVQLLTELELTHQFLFSELEFQSALGMQGYEEAHYTDSMSRVHFEQLRQYIDAFDNITSIWYVQNEHEYSTVDYDVFYQWLKTSYPDQLSVFFANTLTEVDINFLATEEVIPKSLLNRSFFSTVKNRYNEKEDTLGECIHKVFKNELKLIRAHSESLNQLECEDYTPYIQRYRLVNENENSIHLPIPLKNIDAETIYSFLIYYAEKYKVLDFDFGLVDLEDAAHLKILRDWSEKYADLPFSFRFHCKISSETPTVLFDLLKESRISSVSLIDIEVTHKPTAAWIVEHNISRLNCVKKIQALGIKVHWNLMVSAHVMENAVWKEFETQIPLLYTFTAPEGVLWADLPEDRKQTVNTKIVFQTITNYIRQWKAQDPEYCLSMGNGPTFSRLFDRRGGVDSWRFINLNKVQRDLYSLLNEVTSMDKIRAKMKGVPSESIERFMDFLQEQGLVLSLQNRKILMNLSKRREFDEAWATAEL